MITSNSIVAPLVSIIIPTYNTKQYICEAIDSALAQTYKNIEIIVVDDGSTDNTKDILEEYIHKNQIIYHYQKNMGLSSARNTGILLSKGDYILCLDADDKIEPEYLQETAPILRDKADIGIVYTWVKTFESENDIWKLSEFDLFSLLQKNRLVATALFRKEIWQKIGGYDEKMKIGLEDWDFWIRAYLAGYKFANIPKALFLYRKKQVSMVTKLQANYFKAAKYIRLKYKEVYFKSLWSLLIQKPFGDVGIVKSIIFWIYNLYYRYLPEWMQKRIYQIHKIFTLYIVE